jgi:hypothetical protein
MAAIAQPTSTAALAMPQSSYRNSLHTAVVAAAATFMGALLVSALMALSIVLAGPLSASDGAPSSQPVPQPTAAQGLGL